MSIFSERQWERAGRATRAAMEKARRPVREAVRADQERALDAIPFASSGAECLAMDRNLGWGAFDGLTPSSARGFTIGDVRALLAFGEAEGGSDG